MSTAKREYSDVQRQRVLQLYQTMLPSEIASEMGIETRVVYNIINIYRPKHSAMAIEAIRNRQREINRINIKHTHTPESRAKARATHMRKFKMERERVFSGQSQHTRIKVATVSQKIRVVIWYLTREYGYFEYIGEPVEHIYYDKNTQRRPLTGRYSEEYYKRKYGFKFIADDEPDFGNK